ncbi:unnamed protein product [Linum trigynum]|uniref:Uncharacterized protein n=1 Tax=Linum trigynum TaxID=586398 RepID=A0AAV2E269_9ROSI
MPPKKNSAASQDVGDDDGSNQAGWELAEVRTRAEALDRRIRATEEELGPIKSTTDNLERGQTALQVVVEEIRTDSQTGYKTLAQRQAEADAKLDRINRGQDELRASNDGIWATIAQLAEMIAGMGSREPARRTVDLIVAGDKLKGTLAATEEKKGNSSPLPVTPQTTSPRGAQGGELLKTRDHAIQALSGAWGSLAMDTGDYQPPSGLPIGIGGAVTRSAGGAGTGASGSGPADQGMMGQGSSAGSAEQMQTGRVEIGPRDGVRSRPGRTAKPRSREGLTRAS